MQDSASSCSCVAECYEWLSAGGSYDPCYTYFIIVQYLELCTAFSHQIRYIVCVYSS